MHSAIRSSPLRRATAIAVTAALVASPSHAGIVATWRSLGNMPMAYGGENVMIERFDGARAAIEVHRVMLHSMDLSETRAALPIDDPASADSLLHGADGVEWTLIDLDKGTYAETSGDYVQRRSFATGLRPRMPPDAFPGNPDSAAVFEFVGIDTIAGFPARHFRTSYEQPGFLGIPLPETAGPDSLGFADLTTEFLLDVWFAGPDERLDRLFEARARFPKLVTSNDSVFEPDTLLWHDDVPLPPALRKGALAKESGRIVGADYGGRMKGALADSMRADPDTLAFGLRLGMGSGEDRIWLHRIRLVSLREEPIRHEDLELPRDRVWKEADW
jgi:hypothetical protein